MKAVQLVRVVGVSGVVASLTACPTAPPVINPASGPQPCPFTVTMTDATQSSTIHYSFAPTPVSISSPIYTGPLSINGQATVYAFATSPAAGGASTTTTTSYSCRSNEPTYGNMEFDITTGSDDARSDTEIDATVSVSLGTGSRLALVLKASGDRAWTSAQPSIKVFPLNPPLPASSIGGVYVTLVEHDEGVETDDNWDLQSISVLLYNQPTAKTCVIASGGARLTATSPSVLENEPCPP